MRHECRIYDKNGNLIRFVPEKTDEQILSEKIQDYKDWEVHKKKNNMQTWKEGNPEFVYDTVKMKTSYAKGSKQSAIKRKKNKKKIKALLS